MNKLGPGMTFSESQELPAAPISNAVFEDSSSLRWSTIVRWSIYAGAQVGLALKQDQSSVHRLFQAGEWS